MDISRTIEADSTQVNAVDLTGSPRIVTITDVNKGPDSKQPVNLELAEFPGRSYRPCKSMRRILVHAWGPDAKTYVGRRMRLYNDESVRWAGKAVGGIRINGLSDISTGFQRTLQESQKSYVTYAIEKLPDQSPADRIAALRAEWKAADEERRQVIAVEVDALNAKLNKGGQSGRGDGNDQGEGAESSSGTESLLPPGDQTSVEGGSDA